MGEVKIDIRKGCFLLECLNDKSFPTFFVRNCSPNSKTIEFSLMSLADGQIERWIDSASSEKRYDFVISFLDSVGYRTHKFLVLNSKLINKSFSVDYDKNRCLNWDLEFSHSYFGEDKPQQRVTIGREKYDSYKQIKEVGSSANYCFLLKQQKEEFNFITSNFNAEYLDDNKTYGPRNNHRVYGKSTDGWLLVSSNPPSIENNRPSGISWGNTDNIFAVDPVSFIKLSQITNME